MFYLQHEKNKKKMKENEIFTELKGNVPMGQKTHWNVFICGLWYYLEIKKQTVKNLARFDL